MPDSAAATAGSGVGNPWWNPLGLARIGAAPCGTGCGCRGCGVGTSNLWYNPCGGPWFGSVGALGMTRNTPNAFWTTSQANFDPNQILNTKQAGNGQWGPGGQVMFGRWFCPCACANPCGTTCGPQYMYGLQFVYWQLADMNSSVGANSNALGLGPTNLNTPIDMTTGAGGITLNGNQVDHYFDGTTNQGIWRTNRFLNIEINGLVQPIYNNPGCFSATLLGGFRYFRFQDILTYGSAAGTSNFGDARRDGCRLLAIQRDEQPVWRSDRHAVELCHHADLGLVRIAQNGRVRQSDQHHEQFVRRKRRLCLQQRYELRLPCQPNRLLAVG